jgi:peptide-methionine (S)-S-oxide reductase
MFLFDVLSKKIAVPKAGDALPGRDEAIATAERHFVNDRPLKGPYPDGAKTAGNRGRLCWRSYAQSNL